VRRVVGTLCLALAACRAGGEAVSVAAPKSWIGGSEIASNDGDWRIVYKIADGPVRRGETFSIDAWVFAADAPEKPRADVSLAVDAAMPQHGHGMNRVPHVENLGAGRFRIDGLDFHMPGKWELYFDVAHGPLIERAQADVEVE
jgi:YtkA-like protein